MPPNMNEDSKCPSSAGSHRIPAFFLLRRSAKITLLYSHGNAEDLGMMYRRMKDMARVLGVNVLAYDYSGYGLSQPPCEPSERMCYRNIDAAYNYLIRVMKIPHSRIILYGRSLGSGPSCYLAKRTADEGKSVAGLILHSPFLSIYRIVLDVKSGFVGDIFQSYTRAKSIKCPVLMIHGEKDQVVPFWHSDELLRLFKPEYRAKPFFVKGMGHNNIEIRLRQEYIKAVVDFFDICLKKGGTVPQNQRYMPSTTLNESGKFIVNNTWIKHGREILRHALENDNHQDSNQQETEQKRKQVSQPTLPKPSPPPPPSSPPPQKQLRRQLSKRSENDPSGALDRSITNELVAKLINDDGIKETVTTQFLESMESWDTEGTDVKNCSFDSNVELNVSGKTIQLPSTPLINEFKKSQKKEIPANYDSSSVDRERIRDNQSPLENLTNQL
jgi:pimeloyl-ACP methyl ester carboxylesterase